MTPAWVDQDALTIGVDGEAEMIGHRLMPAEPRGEPECGGKIDPRLAIVRKHARHTRRGHLPPLTARLAHNPRIEEVHRPAKESLCGSQTS